MRQKNPERFSPIFGMCEKTSRDPTSRCSEMMCVELDIFQGQGMHRKRHAVIKSVTFFYKNKTLSRDYLEAGVHVYVLMSYAFTKKPVLLYVLGQSAKDSEVLPWFTHHYYNGYSDSRLIFSGLFTSGTISILLSPQLAFKVSLWYLARATWHDSPGSVSHVRFCTQGTVFAEERGTREERLENPFPGPGEAPAVVQREGRTWSCQLPHETQTTNSCYSADAKKTTPHKPIF